MSAAFVTANLREDHRYDAAFLCRSEYACDTIYRFDFSFLELGIAAGHEYVCFRILPVKLPDYVAALLVGMFGNRACVHKEYVSSLAPRHCLEAFLCKLPLISRGLRIIQLTA